MTDDLVLLNKLLEIYEQRYIAEYLNEIGNDCWNREKINRWLNGKATAKFSFLEYKELQKLLPKQKENSNDFRFIDLFAGIGGIRKGFESVGGHCVFTSEWDRFAIKTYKANYNNCLEHIFNEDIRDITLSNKQNTSENESFERIESKIPNHDVLLAGFPCQPFSLAGVSKKNALGRLHGFACQTQGTLFFDIARILKVKRPVAFMLENVKNLKSHDKGKTFKVILETLDKLGYFVADSEINGSDDPKIIDAQNFLPQHRERIILVGFRKDLNIHEDFTLKNVKQFFPVVKPTLSNILQLNVNPKYILTERLWEYLYNYAKKHQAKGNGFGYGLVNPNNETVITRTLSARYHKDGSEILIDRGWDFELGERDFWNKKNQANRPRRLTPRECARLMGFDKPNESDFIIPVSDTQAYKQFGNSVCVPVFESVAKLMKPYIIKANNKKMIFSKKSVLA
ncbi:MAG: DNA (cytosine-5-)-methyltransferase [Clostridia bacterium]